MADIDFPTFPSGFWRRIRICPGVSAGGQRWIGGALEDDMHCFHMRIEHDGTRIAGLAARALRHPWSACSASPAHLAARLSGRALAELAAEDPAQHCTHLHDLAILLAAHADDRAETRFDMTVADRVEGRTTATISVDGAAALAWPLEGLVIAGGVAGEGAMAGRDLRQLSRWKHEYPPREAELATLLRRAIFVSGARAYTPPEGTMVATDSPGRMGVCFNYQLPQASTSTRNPDWHTDFSGPGREPLAGFDPAQLADLA